MPAAADEHAVHYHELGGAAGRRTARSLPSVPLAAIPDGVRERDSRWQAIGAIGLICEEAETRQAR